MSDRNASSLNSSSGSKTARVSLKRRIAGVKVRFYKRTAGSNLSMDFEVEGERFQESTGWPHIADAERVALRRIEEIKAARLSLGAQALVRGSMATVGDVCEALMNGDKVMEDRTRTTYLASLKRLARVVDEDRPEEVALNAVLQRAVLERFVSEGQGREGRGVNWHDALPENVGLNSTVRNASSVFQERIVERHLKGLRLPPLEPLRKFPSLPTPPTHFVPWPVENLTAMDAAAQMLKGENPELYLCHIMLRRLGLRDAELLAARSAWVQWNEAEGKAWLDVRPRAPEGEEPGFRLLKGGRPRRLALDAEIQGLLRGRTGFLIGQGWGESRRYDFIYREHCEWLRPFVPAGRSKVNHELRKLSASSVYTEHGIAAAAYFLGDSVATTEGYYATWTGEAPVVRLGGPAMAVPAERLPNEDAPAAEALLIREHVTRLRQDGKLQRDQAKLQAAVAKAEADLARAKAELQEQEERLALQARLEQMAAERKEIEARLSRVQAGHYTLIRGGTEAAQVDREDLERQEYGRKGELV